MNALELRKIADSANSPESVAQCVEYGYKIMQLAARQGIYMLAVDDITNDRMRNAPALLEAVCHEFMRLGFRFINDKAYGVPYIVWEK